MLYVYVLRTAPLCSLLYLDQALAVLDLGSSRLMHRNGQMVSSLPCTEKNQKNNKTSKCAACLTQLSVTVLKVRLEIV